MNFGKRMTALLFIFFVTVMLWGSVQEDKTLTLQVGNRKLREKAMEVTPGKIYSAQEGKPISFSKMIVEMGNSGFVYVGETHNSLPMHEIQARIIQALYEQDRDLSIGLEMFPVAYQDALNKWSLGILSQDEFIQESSWYVNWNFNFGFYEGIFRLAKENKIPVYALNVPREIISKIRMRGWEGLSEEEKKIVPDPDLSHQGHRELIRTIFEATELPHQMKGKGLEMAFEGLYRAQSAWDEVMALNAVIAQKREDKKVVVLAGSGHLIYNLGISRRVYERSPMPYKTVICVPVPEGRKGVTVSRSLADYVWAIPEEKIPVFPSVGLRIKKFEGLDNLVIENDPISGVALGADFKKGDIILGVDGKSFSDLNELRIYLAGYKWNDEVKFRLLRSAKEMEVLLRFKPSEQKIEEN